MSRKKTVAKTVAKTDTKPEAEKKPAAQWVQYLPAIITATTALVEVLLKHFHP